MGTAEWVIQGPDDYAWTPAEIAQIGRAVQAFEATLPDCGGKIVHLVSLEQIKVIDGRTKVDWPQPELYS